MSPLTSHVFAKPLSALLIAGQMSLSIPVAAADDAAPQAAAPTAAAPPQTIAPTVKVNRTVPAVTAAPLMPRFSAEPTDEEITRARVFDEPIMPMPGAGSASENRTLADAILAYLDAGGGDRLDALRRFLGVYPDSRWRASLLTGMGVSYRRTGHFSRALAAWEEAWSLAKESEDARIKATADRAVGELFELNARLGRFNVLERLFEEIGDRDIRGSATEKVSGARQALWLMHNRTGEAFRCGPLAIYSILRAAQPELLQPKPIEMCKSTKQGTSLLQLRDLSIEVGRPMLMARRDPGSHVYTPSVVHWKVGHFAALVAADEDRYLVQDPTFGDEFWVSQATLDEEASGYFLIPEGILVPGWVRVDDQTGATLWGKGAPAGVDSTDVGDEPECPTCPTGGMGPGRGLAVASIHMMLASIRLKDIPVGYSPPVGPSSDFRVTYNQRETFQPQTFYYSNLGPKWTPDWLSYIEDDPGNPSAALTIYKRNGGRETSTSFNSATQSYAPTVRSQAVVKRVSASPIAYERELPDGLIEVFTQPDGAMTSPRKVFLTAIKDPAGNALTFTYDGSLRLVAATDAIGQVTTIAYEHADPLKITKVTDPFGRSATFEYDGGGRLQRITDVLGLQSSLTYGAGDVVKTLTTPYGTTTFTSGEVGIRRWAELTDPSGGKERVEYGFGLSYSDPANLVPSGMNTINAALDHHNTLYWDKRAMAVAPGERWAATDYHWALISTGAYQASAVPLSVKRPLEHRTWFNYHGGGGNTEGTLRKLTAIGRVNHQGATELWKFAYNVRGRLTRAEDPAGRVTTYLYASNAIDQIEVRRGEGASSTLISARAYGASHRIVEASDGVGNASEMTYNSRGQLKTLTPPAAPGHAQGPTATYEYDATGYLTGVTVATSGWSSTLTYDAYGRVRTLTDGAGLTRTYEYDALDRLVRVTFGDGTYQERVYDRLDVRRTRDRSGRWSHNVYDSVRRIVSVTDAVGATTTYEWCACGSLDATTDANKQTTRREYDLQGRITKLSRANGTYTLFAYHSGTGRLASITRPTGIVTTLAYASDGRLTTQAFSDGTPTISYTYDPITGLLTAASNAADTLTWTYDAVDRLMSESSTRNAATVQYTWSGAGQRTTTSIDNQLLMSYTYDSSYRLASLVYGSSTVYFSHDAASRRTALSYPNDVVTTYVYDDESNLLEIVSTRTGIPVASLAYTHDSLGNITSKTTDGWSEAYTYDSVARLASVVRSGSLSGRTHSAYDPVGNRVAFQDDTQPRHGIYNNINQLVATEPGGTIVVAGAVNEPAAVTVGGKPANVKADNTFTGTAVVGAGTNTIAVDAVDPAGNPRTSTYEIPVTGGSSVRTYDLDGNMVKRVENGSEWQYEWTALRQLRRVLKDGSEIARFEYDPLGRRVFKTVNGIAVTFLLDGGNILRERRSDGTERTYAHALRLDDIVASRDSSGTMTYYHSDALGSIIRTTGADGSTIQDFRYDAWGNLETGATVEGFTFTGREWEPQIGLYYFRARYADMRAGIFLSEDPIPARGSLYAYVRNNPTTFVDPLGLKEIQCPGCKEDQAKEIREGFVSLCKLLTNPKCAGALYEAQVLLCFQKVCFDPKDEQVPTFKCVPTGNTCASYAGSNAILIRPPRFYGGGCGENSTNMTGTLAHEMVHWCVQDFSPQSPGPDCEHDACSPGARDYTRKRTGLVETSCDTK